ncbi:MAG: SAM-dependent methyltransferase [Clostridia bacterium]|nr:SAM-dependent methyltransferase [Clostridia bacterium]
MSYGKRIDTLCSLLVAADTFADVGCDHGYCSEYMLKNGLCAQVILSDISKGSLEKAKRLLVPYIRKGMAIPVLGDGFKGVPRDTEEVLIAGMGGSEIISILSDERYGFIPKRFVFQPMHDSEKLRRYLVENGGYIERDFTFEDGKFYDVLVGGVGNGQAQTYTDAEYEFGKENLARMPQAFIKRTEKLIKNVQKYLEEPNLQLSSRTELEKKLQRLQGVLCGEVK